jgi:hypothetical protein
MSYLYIFLTSVVLTFSGAAVIPHAEVEKAFNDNDEAALVALTKDKVLMTVTGNDGAFSKPQAKLILRDFFAKYPNGKFSFIFKAKPSETGSFSIGNYVVKDETFRITFQFKKEGNVFKIETLNIER